MPGNPSFIPSASANLSEYSELTLATMKINLASVSVLLAALTPAVAGQDSNDPSDALVRIPL